MRDPIAFVTLVGPVARHLLGEPNRPLSSRSQLRFGTHGSLAVEIAGAKAGTWYDHETGKGGGVLDLIARETGRHNGEAVAWLQDHDFVAAEEPKARAERKIAATYDYHDAIGVLAFQVVRFDPKDFRQRRPDGNGGWHWNLQGIELVLYRLPELLRAAPSAIVYVCEGEKDADALRDHLATATTCPGGAGKWRDRHNDALRGRHVVILPDNDAPGEAHAQTVAKALAGIAASVRVLRLPDLPAKGDVSDWIGAGGTAEELAALADAAPEWRPDPAADPQPPPGPPRTRFPLLFARDITPVLNLRHLVRGRLLAASAVVMFGPSNSGKTFLATDLALHVAAGLPWHGRATVAGGVLYVALEGGGAFRNRVSAWFMDHPEVNQNKIPFAAVTAPLRLIEPGRAEELIETIRDAWPPEWPAVVLVVVDTVSRALAGADENDSAAMGALVAVIDAIRAATGAAVLGVHHTGKDTTRGARGHSLLRAAVDTEIEVSATGDDRAATVTKQRDLASGARIGFRLRVVELGRDLTGEPVTSCVVDPAEAGAGRPSMSRGETGALRVLQSLIAAEGKPLPAGPGFPCGLRSVLESRWRDECYARRLPSNAPEANSRAKGFRRAFHGLQEAGAVAARDGLVWATAASSGDRGQGTTL